MKGKEGWWGGVGEERGKKEGEKKVRKSRRKEERKERKKDRKKDRRKPLESLVGAAEGIWRHSSPSWLRLCSALV